MTASGAGRRTSSTQRTWLRVVLWLGAGGFVLALILFALVALLVDPSFFEVFQ